MDLIWIEDFLALAANGSFSRAAEERHVTQPAFSRRIRALERWVGTDLVDRSSHHIGLTAAGNAFRLEADEALRRMRHARGQALEAANEDVANVPMASTHMLASTFLPDRLARTTSASEDEGRVQLLVDNMTACERLMLSGRVSLLLCHHHDAAPSVLEGRFFERTTVGRDLLVAVSAPDDEKRPRHPLPDDDGTPVSYLAYREEAGLGRILEATAFAARTPPLRPVFHSHAALTLTTMARAGRGLVFAPLSLVERDLRDGSLVRAGDLSVEVDICLIRARARQRPAVEALWTRLSV